jgi:hypothetical protein
MTSQEALAFVERHGIVLQAARGPVPSLAEAIAGGPIKASWWGHPKGREIFVAAEGVIESGEVLVCKLLGGKVTYVHRRLWPALVRLASRFGREQLAQVWSEHTASGAHRLRRVPFPKWVPRPVAREAARLSEAEAERQLGPLLGLLTPGAEGRAPRARGSVAASSMARGRASRRTARGRR